jgi:hypothetical protein
LRSIPREAFDLGRQARQAIDRRQSSPACQTVSRLSKACLSKTGERKMISGSVALLWLLMGGTAATAPATEPAAYSPVETPFASMTLLVDGTTNAVQILNQNNVAIKIIPSEYQDLKITKSFAIECTFPRYYPLKTIGARVDSRYHLIPLTVLEYKEFDPSYVKVEINTAYFTNNVGNTDPNLHKVYIDFYPRN